MPTLRSSWRFGEKALKLQSRFKKKKKRPTPPICTFHTICTSFFPQFFFKQVNSALYSHINMLSSWDEKCHKVCLCLFRYTYIHTCRYLWANQWQFKDSLIVQLPNPLISLELEGQQSPAGWVGAGSLDEGAAERMKIKSTAKSLEQCDYGVWRCMKLNSSHLIGWQISVWCEKGGADTGADVTHGTVQNILGPGWSCKTPRRC